MSELKFRVWDKIGQRLVMPDDLLKIDFESGKVSYKEKRYDDDGSFFGFYAVKRLIGQVEMLQCTGLKDVIGKDIYEGDIVRDVETETYYDIKMLNGYFVALSGDDIDDLNNIAHRVEIVRKKGEEDGYNNQNLG